MSSQVTTAFVEQYKSNVMDIVQQKGSRLRSAVMTDTVQGKKKFVEQVGTTNAQLRTSRHADSPLVNTPHLRRSLTLDDYEWGDLIDNADRVRLLIDPTDAYARNAAWAMGRAMDDVIITAMLGSAYTGVSGGTETVLPSGQKIAAGTTGFTLDKLIEAREILMTNEVSPDEELYVALNANHMSDLLANTSVTSSDFASVKALVRGEINSYMGFNFIHSERLTGAAADRKAIAWAKSGVQLGIGADIRASIAPRADKSFSTYVYYSMSLGATRLEEEKVVEIGVKEDHS
tara:strand:- start:3480 stop:4346 length:867 start_codon:yes stop_codon:yes gene_type:complete